MQEFVHSLAPSARRRTGVAITCRDILSHTTPVTPSTLPARVGSMRLKWFKLSARLRFNSNSSSNNNSRKARTKRSLYMCSKAKARILILSHKIRNSAFCSKIIEDYNITTIAMSNKTNLMIIFSFWILMLQLIKKSTPYLGNLGYKLILYNFFCVNYFRGNITSGPTAKSNPSDRFGSTLS